MYEYIQELMYVVFCVAVGMVGYHIHHSLFWAFMNWLFAPFTCCYWLVTHQVNLTTLKETFGFFLQ